MFALKVSRSPFPAAALLAVVGAIALGGHALAQPQRPVYIPPDVKGFQAQRMLQRSLVAPSPVPVTHHSAPTLAGPAPTVPVPVQLTLTFPGVPDAAFVAIRGPDGEVRYFPVEGGRKGLATRVIVVRPGERVHIQLPPPKTP